MALSTVAAFAAGFVTGWVGRSVAGSTREAIVQTLVVAHRVRDGARRIVEDTLAHSSEEEKADYGVIKEKIRADLKRYISKETQRRPLIMPVILEI